MLFMKKILLFLSISATLFSSELITPIPLNDTFDVAKAKLGKKLFFDTRLSADDSISCSTCHNLDDGGDDGLSVSFGVEGRMGTRNSPTVFNARYNFVQFWDGRASDLQEQAEGPIHNHVEMNSNFKEVISKLQLDTYYVDTFNAIYTNGITAMNITDAIAEFEKALITPNSKFDRFLRGEINALNEKEKKGYALFNEYGCVSCHNGVNMGGNLFQKIGVVKDFNSSPKEFGRYSITRETKDILVFKVPTLRNIALTAPYFHDGKVQTLDEAVSLMIKHQIGVVLSEEDIPHIVAFLQTLTGEKPKFMDKEVE